jgi:hypothetical protein
MPKNPRRKNLKPTGKCIFCEGGAVPGNPMTGEHLWSDWMDRARLLPRGGEYFEFKTTVRRLTGETLDVFRRTRQGTANKKKIKVVCHNCNSGWMGTLEGNVQPYLTPLIKGTAITLDAKARQTISEWVFMKALVAEHNYYLDRPADPIFDQSVRTTFMDSRAIPQGVRMWIAMQNSAKWITGFHRFASGLGFTTTLPPPPIPATRTKNVQSVTWGIGRLLIYVSAATDLNVFGHFELDRTTPLSELWPLTPSDITWPPRFFVTDPFIDDLASALERFIKSDAVIQPSPTPSS